MPVAEIITIGTELLLGEIQDTNSRYLARAFRDAGIDLFRATTVGDNVQRIAIVIRESLTRADIVITTGGLGPTVDDPTRQAVADAIGVELEFHSELWDQIQDRFKRYNRIPGENNKKQAYLPRGAITVENPVGTAPAFISEVGHACVISLPGVPREMEHLLHERVFPYLRRRYDIHGIIKARVIHTASIGESMVDEKIADLELLSNPSVGLLAHPGQTDVRITAKAESEAEADQMIDRVAMLVRERLAESIFGEDEDTLEGCVLEGAAQKGWSFSIMEYGLDGGLLQRLSQGKGPFMGGELLPKAITLPDLEQKVLAHNLTSQADLVLGAVLTSQGPLQHLDLVLSSPMGIKKISRSYGGPPQNAALWAIHQALDFVRLQLLGVEVH